MSATDVINFDSIFLPNLFSNNEVSRKGLILELKDKLGAIDSKSDSALMRDEIETLEALQALGYSTREAREAMKKISKTATNSGERIKEALKILGKQE